MRVSISSSLLLLAFGATNAAAHFTNQSSLFSLVLTSSNSTLNGSVLAPCHEGAAIEGLCVSSAPPANISTAYFQFNTSSDASDNGAPDDGPSGILTYLLQGSNFNLSSPMELQVSDISNVAVPVFSPSDSSTYVSFDCDEKLNILGYTDDTVSPQAYDTVAYYRWYACITNFSGYSYQTLAWVLGTGAPENPTCEKVDVVRVFA